MYFAFDGPIARLTGAAVDVAAFHPPPAIQKVKPFALCPVSSLPSSGVSPGRPNSPPQTTNVSSRSPAAQDLEAERHRCIGRFAIRLQIATMVLVLIPTTVIDLDKTHSGFGKATSQQTLSPEVGFTTRADALAFLPTRYCSSVTCVS